MTRLRLVLALCALLPALAQAAGIGEDGARLLLTRTGFGANPAKIAELAPLSRAQAVDRVLANPRTEPLTPPPGWVMQPIELPRYAQLPEDQKKALRQQENQRALELKGWWLGEMRATDSPISEKMTLFWHNHFVSGLDKVRSPELMARQNLLLRREALGNFGTLLHEIAHDPAMMRYLDTANNRKGQPNENFAREVMELFTLGEGHYSEQDIREAARAFTGWGMQPGSGDFINRPRQHDDGIKTVFGQSGNYDGDQVLGLLLQRPDTARFVTTKLWRYLVSPTPDPRSVDRLAAGFYDSGYQIKPLVRALLMTDAFWKSGGQLVKSPVELTVGTLVTFDLTPADYRPLALFNRNLGQDLFSPPNVKGWPGGDDWINSATLLARKQFLARLSGGGINLPSGGPAMLPVATGLDDPSQKATERRLTRLNLDTADWAERYHVDSVHRASHLLLPVKPASPPQAGDAGEVVRELLLDAAYQVD
ncbi:DUF1800 domain-containing protein [Crenobacter sp. SG2305]|uniref:DUF1800 domain-containing protein n=1 Tax=Crenobacter oryzisoli TaxID=3056844 RepID=UPI0025AB080F|nr:DUF1800 domain-containing protein [Crenobacter sp. SG2305]MDN0084060.1 DUF1800 domain-containing protein [Crenobacter sp. SG2305]